MIGSEILRGIIQDTNSHWLTRKLVEIGYRVKHVIAIPDEYGEIEWAVRTSIEVSDVVITTGGLGFTSDDITIEAVAKTLNLRISLHEGALEMIKNRVGAEKLPLYIKAAYLPEKAIPLRNNAGISPGVYLNIDNKHIFILPGVPREMTSVFTEEVEPILRRLVEREHRVVKATVTTDHVWESEVDELINQVRREYPDVYFKTHASTPVKLSIVISTATGNDPEKRLGVIIDRLKDVIRVREVFIEK